jgi:hypothetical protein
MLPSIMNTFYALVIGRSASSKFQIYGAKCSIIAWITLQTDIDVFGGVRVASARTWYGKFRLGILKIYIDLMDKFTRVAYF